MLHRMYAHLWQEVSCICKLNESILSDCESVTENGDDSIAKSVATALNHDQRLLDIIISSAPL